MIGSRVRTGIAASYLTACVLLGGASAAGVIGNAALQIVAVIILIALLFIPASDEERRSGSSKTSSSAIGWVIFLFLGLIILQLVPLPPPLWAALPGRAETVVAFRIIGVPIGWMPLTLTPEGTIASALAFLPPLAILCLLAPARVHKRTFWAILIVVIALVELVLGATQVAGGPDSPLYFYAFTNWGSMVGFFANANHHSTLLLMATPFSAALAVAMFRQGRQRHDVVAKGIMLASLFGVIAGGVLVNGSRAGLLLLPIILLLCACMVRMDLTRHMPKLWLALTGTAIAGGSIFAASAGYLNLEQLGHGASSTSRAVIWDRSWQVAKQHFPGGGGLGSFVPLYRIAEDPLNRSRAYANHAHNDYLEWLLETGLPGVLLLIVFFLWYARRSWEAWTNIEASLPRAASIAIAAVLVHSVVDYPIRTAAISALFALCCAMLLSPVIEAPAEDDARANRGRRSERGK